MSGNPRHPHDRGAWAGIRGNSAATSHKGFAGVQGNRGDLKTAARGREKAEVEGLVDGKIRVTPRISLEVGVELRAQISPGFRKNGLREQASLEDGDGLRLKVLSTGSFGTSPETSTGSESNSRSRFRRGSSKNDAPKTLAPEIETRLGMNASSREKFGSNPEFSSRSASRSKSRLRRDSFEKRNAERLAPEIESRM